jgi:hypothetical protein
MTEIKKNESNDKHQKSTNSSKSKRSSSSSTSLSSLRKNATVNNSGNASLNNSNEIVKKESPQATEKQPKISSNKEQDIEKGLETKKKTLSQSKETLVVVSSTDSTNRKIETSSKNAANNKGNEVDEGGILILVDFELTHADRKAKKSRSTSNPRLDVELESLSQILPLLSYKLTNYNLHEYMEDFDK